MLVVSWSVPLLICLAFGARDTASHIIPPAWADQQFNPCAKSSWQLIYWKADGKCYPIFKQGFPCPATQELVFDSEAKEAKCQCPADRLFWEEDQRCYAPWSTGPCPEGSFLHPGSEHLTTRGLQHRPDPHRRTLHQVQAWLGQQQESNRLESLGFVHCKQKGFCPANWAFWPPTENCYLLNSQGPCQSGSLFRWNASTNQAECGCQSTQEAEAVSDGSSWRPYYWPIGGTCHEHGTLGPCRGGEVFVFNHTTQVTQCTCSKQMANYHSGTDKCYEKFTRGPCNAGMWLVHQSQELPEYSVTPSQRPVAQQPPSRVKTAGASGKIRIKQPNISRRGRSSRRSGPTKSLVCTCLPGFVYSDDDDQCFREYTQGPCRPGYIFMIDRSNQEAGVCWKNPCGRNELFVPETQRCYKIHSKGPCPDGQLVMADDQHGISYRGRCGCSAVLLPQHYWPPDGKCYAHESRGPCPSTQVLSVRSGNGLTPACLCPEEFGLFNDTGLCYKVFSQGPCQWNEWLVPSVSGDVNDVDNGERPAVDSSEHYVCQCKPGYEYHPGSTYCQPPSLELLYTLPKTTRNQRRVNGNISRRRLNGAGRD